MNVCRYVPTELLNALAEMYETGDRDPPAGDAGRALTTTSNYRRKPMENLHLLDPLLAELPEPIPISARAAARLARAGDGLGPATGTDRPNR